MFISKIYLQDTYFAKVTDNISEKNLKPVAPLVINLHVVTDNLECICTIFITKKSWLRALLAQNHRCLPNPYNFK